jgi:hypothetical protein
MECLAHIVCFILLLPVVRAGASDTVAAYPPTPPRERLVGLAYSTWFTSTNWTEVWGTPELDRYRSDDRSVIRKHARWIADAGVDFIWIDWSNDVNYFPGESVANGTRDMIERSTQVIFEEYAKLKRRPKISIFLGVSGAPEAVKDGRLQRKADQLHQWFVTQPRFRPLLQDYLGKPLLVVYVNTPSPFQTGVPEWNDPRFTVRWMTGYVTEQTNLRTPEHVSRFGYWSWEDRGPQTFTVHAGHPEAMVVVASWRPQSNPGERDFIPAAERDGGRTFREQWARARSIGPRFAMVVSWNEWLTSEQPSVAVSKDIEPSKELGRQYLNLLKTQAAFFKAGR